LSWDKLGDFVVARENVGEREESRFSEKLAHVSKEIEP
jgi:hypothetical protein